MKRMKVPRLARKTILWMAIAIAVSASIGFTKLQQQAKEMQGVTIVIENQFENYFISEEDILNIVSGVGFDTTSRFRMREFELRDLEIALKKEWFIKDAQLYRDLRGNLVIRTDQRRPIARIIKENGPDAYIGEDGSVLPVSEKFTSRVMLLSGDFSKKLAKAQSIRDDHAEIFELVEFINGNSFWRAQIAQMDIDEWGDIKIYPQVTKQVVVFGKPENLEEKFEKLDVFLKRILPYKGWNTYKTVNLSYEGQIICE